MGSNREAVLIGKSLNRFRRTAKALCIAFVAFAAVFAFMAVVVGVALFLPESISRDQVIGATAAFAQDAAMISTCVLCALMARDVSKGLTPFCKRQVRRIRAAAWVMLAYVVFCAIWDPLLVPVVFMETPVDASISYRENPSGVWINAEALIAAGAFFLFSYILNYGNTLQMLSDETV